MSDPQYCYKCQEILTFCECDEPILSEGDWQRWAEAEIKRLTAKNKRLTTALKPFAEFNDAFKKWCAPGGYVLQHERSEHKPIFRWTEPVSPRVNSTLMTLRLLELWPSDFTRAEKEISND